MERVIGPLTRVCIGMPVRNGQRYVQQAVESILAQTFGELELVISDNASTDDTERICRKLAEKDPRIHYTRLTENIGALANFWRVYHLSGGQYFKWASHDDLLEPTFVQRCVEALDADPTAVLAYPRARLIDSRDRCLGELVRRLPTDLDQPQARFAAVVLADQGPAYNLEMYGLIRRNAMGMIPMDSGYPGADRVFLARLCLYGRFIEVPQAVLFSRVYPENSCRAPLVHSELPSWEWLDPHYAQGVAFPQWRLMWEQMLSAGYGWLNTRQRLLCLAAVIQRQVRRGNWALLLRDLWHAASQLLAGRQTASQADLTGPGTTRAVA